MGDSRTGRIGVALFGLGRAGMIHFKNLIQNHRVSLHWVVDLDVNRVKEICTDFNQTQIDVTTPEDANLVYQDRRIDAVLVCAPTYDHEMIVKAALRSGKAVFCEKPIAETSTGTAACYDVANEVGRPLFCSFNRRFDPALRSIHDQVRAGRLGSVQTVSTFARDSPLPPLSYLKTSGGIFHDCGVHDIDLVCWVLGEYPTSVYATAHAHVKEIEEMGDVDTVAIVLNFPSGAIATINLSRNSKFGYDQRFEVFGDKGMLSSENQRADNIKFSGTDGQLLTPIHHSFPERYRESYVNALNYFLNVVEGKDELEITKETTMKCSGIASACEKSWKTRTAINV